MSDHPHSPIKRLLQSHQEEQHQQEACETAETEKRGRLTAYLAARRAAVCYREEADRGGGVWPLFTEAELRG